MRLAVLALLGACGGDTTHGLFAVPGGTPGDDFYATPFPNDLWRKADGTIDMSSFPTNSLIADSYRAAAESLDGFGKNAAIFTRFDAALDPATLPDPAGSLEDSASVYLVNVDPDSPGLGQKTPIIATFRATGTVTLGANNLSARPFPGFPLDDATTYALVVTKRVHGADGDLEPAETFSQLMGSGGSGDDSAIANARAVYQPLLDLLDQPGGDDRGDIASAAVFTTQSATAIGPALRKGVFATAAPVATGVSAAAPGQQFTIFTGNYTAPNFQTGDVPYRNPPDGQIVVGSDGAAIVQKMEPMRFALTVPNSAVPAAGFPIAIYSHGTGGDYMSFIDDGTAAALTAQGLAVISTDQVLHGPRNPGGNEETDFFNFANPYAIRDNILQGAADAWSQMRLANGLSIVDGARTLTFDPTKVSFFGHSQGGLTGPAFIAFEPGLSGAVLSGTGGVGYLSLLNKTSPVDFPGLIGTLLRDDPVDNDNPSLALAQLWAERSDGVNYAPLMVRTPPTVDGVVIAPHNIYQTEGFTDTFTPNPCIEAFATALGGDIVMTADTKDVPGLDLRERQVMSPPFSNNLDGATAVLAQYKQEAGSDGHFVVFDIAAARLQAAKFLGTLAATGTATVVSN